MRAGRTAADAPPRSPASGNHGVSKISDDGGAEEAVVSETGDDGHAEDAVFHAMEV